MSLIWPDGSSLRPRVTSPYGWRTHPVTGARSTFHRGIDLAGWSTIVAPTAGTVTKVAYQAGGAGHYVNMRADNGDVFKFFHLAARSPLRVGQRVTQGATIGRMGDTGSATGVHLHLEVWLAGRSHTDPAAYYAARQPQAPAPAPPTEEEDEDDMAKNFGIYYTEGKTTVYLVGNYGSGAHHKYSAGTGRGAMSGTYNNALARAFGTDNYAPVTKSHFEVIERSLKAVSRVAGDMSVTITEPV